MLAFGERGQRRRWPLHRRWRWRNRFVPFETIKESQLALPSDRTLVMAEGSARFKAQHLYCDQPAIAATAFSNQND
jgi:hypothetical protein